MTQLTPPNSTPPHIQAHPYASASDPHHPPTLPAINHQPSVPHSKGGTGKSNPIIRHSAVEEKKENFPLVHSRLPPQLPFFLPQVGARWHLRPLWPVAFVFLQAWFILPSFFFPLIPSVFFFCQGYKPLCWVLGPWTDTWEGHVCRRATWLCCARPYTHIDFYSPRTHVSNFSLRLPSNRLVSCLKFTWRMTRLGRCYLKVKRWYVDFRRICTFYLN